MGETEAFVESAAEVEGLEALERGILGDDFADAFFFAFLGGDNGYGESRIFST